MWEEGWWVIQDVAVTPCEGRVSRNSSGLRRYSIVSVTPCEGRVSRNNHIPEAVVHGVVTPCEGRVSRNISIYFTTK